MKQVAIFKILIEIHELQEKVVASSYFVLKLESEKMGIFDMAKQRLD
jgi:hypothetical protein